MTKAEFVDALSEKLHWTKKGSAELTDLVLERVAETVRTEGSFTWPGFGTWSVRHRKARKVRNPQTNEVMKLKASRTIGFRPSKELKARL